MSGATQSTTIPETLYGVLRFSGGTDGLPGWQHADGSQAQPLREDLLPTNGRSEGTTPSAGAAYREIVARLHTEGLAAAAAHAAKWLRSIYLPGKPVQARRFDAVAPVQARSATRVHRIDAVLYIDGVALALLVVDKTLEAATKRLEILEESCPAWFVSSVLLVALGDHSAAVTAPGLADNRWYHTNLGTLAAILRPHALLRSALFDSIAPRRPNLYHRAPLSPEVLRAVELCRSRALQGGDGLVSVSEGEEFAAIRSLVARLQDEGRQAVVVVAKAEQEEALFSLLVDFEVRGPEAGLNAGAVVLTDLQRIGELHEMGFAVERGAHVVIALGVDAGFRGERGFALRLLLPDAPWISITNLPPDAVTPAVQHAFSDAHDDEGFLAIVDTKDRVPVRQERIAFPSERAAELVLPRLPTTKSGTTLILVSTSEEAQELTAALIALAGSRVQVHDATKWGRADEGWRLLKEPTHSVVVLRTSLPYWASVPHLDAVFVVRRVGETTLARLRNMLSRPRPGKDSAFLMLSAGHILQA